MNLSSRYQNLSGALYPDFLDPLGGKAQPFQKTLMPCRILLLEKMVPLFHCRLIQPYGFEAGNPLFHSYE